MSNEETLKAGIEAAKSGDLVRAAALFAEVVQVDPSSEQGWMCLGMSVSNRDRREYCFRRVLALNPNNNEAKSQLERLAGSAKIPPAKTPPTQAPPLRTDTPEKSKPSIINPPTSPFYVEQTDAAPEEKIPLPLRTDTPEKSKPSIINPPTSPFYVEQTDAAPEEKIPSPPRADTPKKPERVPPVQPVFTSQPLQYTFPEDGTPEKSKPSIINPPTSPFYVEQAAVATEGKISSPPAVIAATKAVPKKKKLNNALLLLLGFGATLIVGGVIVAFLFLFGGLNELLTGNISPPEAPVPLPLTALPTSQRSASPTAALKPTQLPPIVLPTSKPTVSYTPKLEKVDCPFDVPSGANVSCSDVIVPEDRTGDPSHTIRLPVVVYHSTSSNPAPDPVVFLQGGPGGEAVKLITGYYRKLVVPILKNRDFIVFDQRGTGLANPALNCDELSKAYLQDVQGLIPSTTRGLVYSNALASCSGLMGAKGINLNAYTTVESADDIKDILNLLGYQKADLYGVSYGTRLAQVVMRDHPEIVHSVILDSVVPVETNSFIQYPQGIEAGLKALFDTCAADPECNAAYPNLETVFSDLLTQLDAKPVTITSGNPRTGTVTQNVDGSTIMNIIVISIKESGLINTAPQSIYRLKNGDFSELFATQASLPFGFEGINTGLFISMMCHEHVLASTPEELQTITVSSKDIEEYAWLPFYGSAEEIFKTCKSWGATGPTLGEKAQVNSDIPALVITGKFDPTTPPIYAKQVASHLSHSYYFEFPNQGHTPTATDTSGCAMNTVVSFLNNPSVEPDRSCLNKMNGIHFLTPYTGTPPIKLTTVKAGGMTSKVPVNWKPTGDGFFFRKESPFDLTNVGLLEVNVSPDEFKDWVSMKAYGYRGLDTVPIQAGVRQVNNIKWTLYTSTSYGRPVDIAMTGYRGWSLVVLLFSNSDEHDALYKTVFLPMVDSATP